MPRRHKIAIIVGHTPKQPGAMGAAPLGVPEHVYNRELAQMILPHITAAGHECLIVVRDPVDRRENAADQANLWRADASLELHFNAFDCKARGSLTLYLGERAQKGDSDLARHVQNGVVTALGRQGKLNRGAQAVFAGDRGHLNLRTVRCPAVLVEPFFGDQPDDAALAVTRKGALAEHLAAAMVAFCDEEFS